MILYSNYGILAFALVTDYDPFVGRNEPNNGYYLAYLCGNTPLCYGGGEILLDFLEHFVRTTGREYLCLTPLNRYLEKNYYRPLGYILSEDDDNIVRKNVGHLN
jgi:hypothetical protein